MDIVNALYLHFICHFVMVSSVMFSERTKNYPPRKAGTFHLMGLYGKKQKYNLYTLRNISVLLDKYIFSTIIQNIVYSDIKITPQAISSSL